LQIALPPGLRPQWRVVRALWLFGLPLVVVAFAFWNTIKGTTFGFEQAPYVLLSPFVTLFSLFRFDLAPPGGVGWWVGPLAQMVLGASFMTLAWVLVFREATQTAEIAEEGRTLLDRVLDIVFWPFRMVGRILTAIGRGIKRAWDALGRALDKANTAVIARGAQLDNAVLTAELRRKVPKTNWGRHWLLMGVFSLIMFLSFGVLPIAIDVWNWSQYFGWSGAIQRIQIGGWGVVVVATVLGIAWLIAALSVSDGGQAFDADRSNGTLVFLFLTPMTDAAIVWGKIMAELMYAVPLLLWGVPWLLIGGLAALFGGESSILPVAFCGVLAVLSTLVFATFVQTLFAVRARKPNEGSGKALLAGIATEAILGALWVAALNHWQPMRNGVWLFYVLLLLITVVHLVLSWVCWHLSLYSMGKLRYGDITAGGKVAG
jgi:hypothetical protein